MGLSHWLRYSQHKFCQMKNVLLLNYFDTSCFQNFSGIMSCQDAGAEPTFGDFFP